MIGSFEVSDLINQTKTVSIVDGLDEYTLEISTKYLCRCKTKKKSYNQYCYTCSSNPVQECEYKVISLFP